MVDAESEVYTAIAVPLREAFPGIDVKSVLTLSPTVFPCACIEQINSTPYRRTDDSSGVEKYTDSVFKVNVYTMGATAKSECKAVMAFVDERFNRMGFARTALNPVPTGDTSKHRREAVYRGVISLNHTVYRR